MSKSPGIGLYQDRVTGAHGSNTKSFDANAIRYTTNPTAQNFGAGQMEQKKTYDYQISVGEKREVDDRKYLDLTPTYYNPNKPLDHKPFDAEPVNYNGQAGGEGNRQALTSMKGLEEGRRKEQDLISYINQKRDQIFKKNRYDEPAEGDPKSRNLSANFKKTPEMSP
jgi:hypothetical protein